MTTPIRLLIVDDHDLFRTGVRSSLDEAIEVVGEASDTDAAIELIRERLPDVVLLDVHLPGGGGRHVVEVHPCRTPGHRVSRSLRIRCPPATSSRLSGQAPAGT